MDISKLTILGFKSFYEKSVFTFEKNITAIVGPNGSGKSNITEAIRFVLGEQSTKSMRGKDISDLLFRGNSMRSTKAKVEIEFVKKGNFNIAGNLENIFIKNALEKDLVVVSRTIYADGKSEYMMNGVEVRVKDLHEFLLYIHLGNKSSWHISQGEADKVLQASISERKTIIEDALGLKVYHSRINESQKKLDKTRENIREATLKRREIMPELSALSKQVERIKRGVEFRLDLENKSSLYLNFKKKKINDFKKIDSETDSIEMLQEKLVKIEKDLGEKELSLYKGGNSDTKVLEEELEREEKVWQHLKNESDELQKKLRFADNSFQYAKLDEERNLEELNKTEAEIKNVTAEGNDIIFSEKNVLETKDLIEKNVSEISKTEDINLAKEKTKDIEFVYKKLLTYGSIVNKDNVKQISYLQSIKLRLQEKIKNIKDDKINFSEELEVTKKDFENSELKLKIVTEKQENLKKELLEYKYKISETERQLQKLTFERSNLQLEISKKTDYLNKILELEREYEYDLNEFKNILGLSFSPINTTEIVDDIDSLKRSIERLKIRLEESQVTNPDEIIQNFNQMTERDNFLIREISDLENSMINLEKLIVDLKSSLKNEFDLGLEHINNIFDSYVKKLFGGGGAKVFMVEIDSKKKNLSEDETENFDEEIKTGIEVEVEIPKKKIKGLHSLSGGERALISIALNFSIINQNPAPFMILDETDAALDEANSKRYGEILEMLKQNTKLIVVTHNRETMHFADQVYGVTLAKEGHSKVLSVSFEDAIEYAK